MTKLMRSWVSDANNPDAPFSLNNLPCGVFSALGGHPRCGVAIGNHILDIQALEKIELINLGSVFSAPSWNAFMALGPDSWSAMRSQLTEMLMEGSKWQGQIEKYLVPQKQATMHMPFAVNEFTDFYASRHHATNVGTMFRGAKNALPPNWLHIPIGYNGRASSVVISGTDIRRPWGQCKGADEQTPHWSPSTRFDFELEMGAIVGQPSNTPISVDQANENIFGYVLLNDWSARDIQAWEYQPLGPFQAKATATTISPWIVTRHALAAFRVATPSREKELLPHLQDTTPMLYDIALEIWLAPDRSKAERIAQTNYAQMYYSSAQQLAHHTTSGCPMRVGDLLGSGTISGPNRSNSGSLLELAWGGKEPLTLASGITRKFIEDGDTIILRGQAKGQGYTIGFGECIGKVLPALKHPFNTHM